MIKKLFLIMFQSPSLRGSGRFVMEQVNAHIARRSFNPLHCGAVVASRRRKRPPPPRTRVSIPFIAGQWSLPNSRRWPGCGPTRFNPLHCGAVVASGRV